MQKYCCKYLSPCICFMLSEVQTGKISIENAPSDRLLKHDPGMFECLTFKGWYKAV